MKVSGHFVEGERSMDTTRIRWVVGGNPPARLRLKYRDNPPPRIRLKNRGNPPARIRLKNVVILQ